LLYEKLKPLIFLLPPELAHSLTEALLRSLAFVCPSSLNFFAKAYIIDDDRLKQELLGLNFYNPVGIAGGFDKNATMFRPLAALGFGFLEFGTFTPKAQAGNEKPRLFRLVEQESLQNAMGFNNDGTGKIASRLSSLYPFILPVGANIGKNKATKNEDAIKDYTQLLESFKHLCDYFIINISSPNTKNLRALQETSFLNELLNEAQKITQKPILIKIAPDMKIKEAINLCQNASQQGAKGFIIANTSTDYSLLDNNRTFGGISGALIKEKSRNFFKGVAKELFNKTLLISSGGIDSAQEAYTRFKDGANLVQIYTALVFKGPSLVKDINEGLLELMQEEGVRHISDIIGENLKR